MNALKHIEDFLTEKDYTYIVEEEPGNLEANELDLSELKTDMIKRMIADRVYEKIGILQGSKYEIEDVMDRIEALEARESRTDAVDARIKELWRVQDLNYMDYDNACRDIYVGTHVLADLGVVPPQELAA